MKKIILQEKADTISIENINDKQPIFAKRGGKLAGMLVFRGEGEKDIAGNYGWYLATGEGFGAYGYQRSSNECIEKGIEYGYEFFIED